MDIKIIENKEDVLRIRTNKNMFFTGLSGFMTCDRKKYITNMSNEKPTLNFYVLLISPTYTEVHACEKYKNVN